MQVATSTTGNRFIKALKCPMQPRGGAGSLTTVEVVFVTFGRYCAKLMCAAL